MTPEGRDEIIRALFNEYDRAEHRGVWVMSPKWEERLRVMFGISPLPKIPGTLFGLWIETQDDAEFPKLEGDAAGVWAGRV